MYTFYGLGDVPVQTRTATSIIGDNTVPPYAPRETFSGSDCFVDRPIIDEYWGGVGW